MMDSVREFKLLNKIKLSFSDFIGFIQWFVNQAACKKGAPRSYTTWRSHKQKEVPVRKLY